MSAAEADWIVAAAAATGSAHLARAIDCEDRLDVRVHRRRDGAARLAAFVSDGAGSAACAAQGADAAVAAAAEVIAAAPEAPLDEALARASLAAARAALAALADRQQRRLRDFACTLVGVVADESGWLALQLGDGAAVLDDGEGLQLALPPMNGEFANMTRFVSDDDAQAQLAWRSDDRTPGAVALFSDGLQRLLIDLATLRPHAPAFERLFGAMRRTDVGTQARHEALSRFLRSEPVTARTDDDTALVLAVRCDRAMR